MMHTEQQTPPLFIGLLGPWDVRLQGGPMPPLRSRKGQWLLALLALQKGRAVERDWLAATLWPDSSGSQGLYNLRRNLSDLRQALGPEGRRIRTPTPQTLVLDLAGAHVDLLLFDEAITRGDVPSLSAAVGLYRGPLLVGCFEAWVLHEREAREQAYLAALERLAADAGARGEHEAAARYLRLAIGVDPLRESAQHALMQALAATGDDAVAARVYRELRLLLARELDAAPSPETTALYHELRAQVAVLAPAEPSCPAPRAPATFPAGVRNRASNVPRPVSSFVGREREVSEIESRLATARLVTLTGAGGVGKTRLAIQVAEEVGAEYPDGVWFVDLGALGDPTLVSQNVARALGASDQPDRTPPETLLEFLRPKRLLLVLDNCEHLLDACARLVELLLGGCPELRVLATSRQSLGFIGETVWRVPPLSLPDVPGQGEPNGVPGLMQYEAVRLFVERGTAAARAFALSERNAEATVAVCRHLDGIPLAIELAAARVKALTVEQIATRLSDRFGLLTAGSRTALPRQQTLRATMDWSYDLLSEPERALLRRLAVFAGGFTLEAAEWVSVLPDPGADRPHDDRPLTDEDRRHTIQGGRRSVVGGHEVLDLLMALVEKSLVQYEEPEPAAHEGGASEARYRLLEIVRQYSRERLLASGEAERVQRSHRDWFVMLAERAEPELHGPDQTRWLQRLETELDNFRSALEWTLGQLGGDESEVGEESERLAGALWRFFYMHGHMREGRPWLERALSQSVGRVTEARAKVLHGAGMLCHEQDQFAAARRFEEESLTIRRQLGDKRAIAESLDQLGHIMNAQGDSERATALFEESLALRREVGDRYGAAASLNALGWMARFHGEYERAAVLSGESLSLRRELGDQWGIAYSLEFLGQLAIEQGDTRSAAAWLTECLSLRQQLGDRRGIAASLLKLGRVADDEGDSREALARCEESLRIWRELGNTPGIAGCLRQMAVVAFHQGDFARAASLYRESLALWQEIGQRQDISPCLEGLAGVACALGQPEHAMRLLGAAEGMRESLGTPLPAIQRAAHEQIMTAARATLGEEVFAAAWAEGRAMTLPQAIAEAREEHRDA